MSRFSKEDAKHWDQRRHKAKKTNDKHSKCVWWRGEECEDDEEEKQGQSRKKQDEGDQPKGPCKFDIEIPKTLLDELNKTRPVCRFYTEWKGGCRAGAKCTALHRGQGRSKAPSQCNNSNRIPSVSLSTNAEGQLRCRLRIPVEDILSMHFEDKIKKIPFLRLRRDIRSKLSQHKSNQLIEVFIQAAMIDK